MIDSLNAAQTGLDTSRYAIDNISNNIANANTEGYKKQSVIISEAGYDSDSYANGVLITGIQRETNVYLYENLINEGSSESYLSKSSDILALAETMFEETDSSGLSVDLNNYLQALEDLRSDSSNEIYKTNFEVKAETLITTMQGLYTDMQNLEDSILEEYNDDAKSINSLLQEIVDVNDELVQNGESLALLDKRDLLENELSTYVDITISDSNNYYKLEIGGETAIFHNTLSYEVEVVDTSTQQKNVYAVDFENISAYSQDIELTYNEDYSISINVPLSASNEDVQTAIIDAINNDVTLKNLITASINTAGNLIITSNDTGTDSSFIFDITVESEPIEKDTQLSLDAIDDVHLEILDEVLTLTSGSMLALGENLRSENSNNYLITYKDALNDLAYALSDLSSSYVQNEDDSYVYGENATNEYTGTQSVSRISLFSGVNISTLQYDSTFLNTVSIENLEYLAQIQWNDDLNISSSSNNETVSLMEFVENLRVNISLNKETVDSKLDIQSSITLSLLSTYEQLTKVDTDYEMIELLQFQAAYEANAKIITAVDEMLQTILNM